MLYSVSVVSSSICGDQNSSLKPIAFQTEVAGVRQKFLGSRELLLHFAVSCSNYAGVHSAS